MLELQCAEVMHTLRHKPIMMTMPPDGKVALMAANDKRRQQILNPLIGKIHTAQKFIFDSGSDQDERTIKAVRETAVNMMEAGLFRQPHPVMWIEDPFDDNPYKNRNFYLTIETGTRIDIWLFSRMALTEMVGTLGYTPSKTFPDLCFYPIPMMIDTSFASDSFYIEHHMHIAPILEQLLGEAVYSYKKLIVTLNTENLTLDKIRPVTGRKSTWDGNPRKRPYDHTIVHIPAETGISSDGGGGGNGTRSSPKRKYLVRGYVWGKNTRPLAEQHWIRPYWRGQNETTIIEHSHYVVK